MIGPTGERLTAKDFAVGAACAAWFVALIYLLALLASP